MPRRAGLLAMTIAALALQWQRPSAAARVGEVELEAALVDPAPLDVSAAWRAEAGEDRPSIAQRHRDRRVHRQRDRRYHPPPPPPRYYPPPPPPGYHRPPPPPAPPPPPSCRATLLELGHSPTSLMFCDGIEPYCADALLRSGHSPTSLMFCNGVETECAVTLLYSGRSPTELLFCN